MRMAHVMCNSMRNMFVKLLFSDLNNNKGMERRKKKKKIEWKRCKHQVHHRKFFPLCIHLFISLRIFSFFVFIHCFFFFFSLLGYLFSLSAQMCIELRYIIHECMIMLVLNVYVCFNVQTMDSKAIITLIMHKTHFLCRCCRHTDTKLCMPSPRAHEMQANASCWAI